MLKNYRIMISHSWDYNEQYEKVKSWLSEQPYFKWSDYSAPLSNSIDAVSKRDLEERLENRIACCSCVIILSGMYVVNSKWINFEIDTAVEHGKPVIGVKPWGNERTPAKVWETADVVVGWNRASVVDAVREYAL